MDVISNLRKAVETVCEGWTLPEDVRKILETALYAETEIKDCITLDAKQLLAAFQLAAPDAVTSSNSGNLLLINVLETPDDQLDTEIVIQHKEAGKDTDGDDAPAGYNCWLSDYPEEG